MPTICPGTTGIEASWPPSAAFAMTSWAHASASIDSPSAAQQAACRHCEVVPENTDAPGSASRSR